MARTPSITGIARTVMTGSTPGNDDERMRSIPRKWWDRKARKPVYGPPARRQALHDSPTIARARTGRRGARWVDGCMSAVPRSMISASTFNLAPIVVTSGTETSPVFEPPYRAAVIGRTGRGDYGHG